MRMSDIFPSKYVKKVYNNISDMFFAAACHYGDEMFRLGIMVGREPEVILDLPDDPYAEKE
jgi:hypothetical protein